MGPTMPGRVVNPAVMRQKRYRVGYKMYRWVGFGEPFHPALPYKNIFRDLEMGPVDQCGSPAAESLSQVP